MILREILKDGLAMSKERCDPSYERCICPHDQLADRVDFIT